MNLIQLNQLKPHEKTESRRLKGLKEKIQKDGVLKKPILVEKGSSVILDGHHRVEILREMGCSKIPAVMVNYEDVSVKVRSRRKSISISKTAVIEAALSNKPFPPRTSKHTYLRIPSTIFSLESLK